MLHVAFHGTQSRFVVMQVIENIAERKVQYL